LLHERFGDRPARLDRHVPGHRTARLDELERPGDYHGIQIRIARLTFAPGLTEVAEFVRPLAVVSTADEAAELRTFQIVDFAGRVVLEGRERNHAIHDPRVEGDDAVWIAGAHGGGKAFEIGRIGEAECTVGRVAAIDPPAVNLLAPAQRPIA